MKTISKGKLKAHMLQVFREIEKEGEELIVTDNHRPVLRIQPLKSKLPMEEVFGELRGKVTYRGDIDAPTEDEWSES